MPALERAGASSLALPEIGLPLHRDGGELKVVRAFGADPERYGQFGLAGHNGLDFETAAGEAVLAVDDGEVMEVRWDAAGYGLTVKLAHVWGESRYAHGLRRSVALDFDLGHIARRGDRLFLAIAGHLHFAVRLRDTSRALDYGNEGGFGGWTDPAPLLGLPLPSREPTAAERRGRRG
ncbi:MAG: M23 family metallopeptidase [Chloroflexi bacterium]|nr:M23 family metallopeptidase [Chloroflexota bacterium]